MQGRPWRRASTDRRGLRKLSLIQSAVKMLSPCFLFFRNGRNRPGWVGYVCGIWWAGLAAFLSWILHPILPQPRFGIYMVAVLITAWGGGLGPALLALVLSVTFIAVTA